MSELLQRLEARDTTLWPEGNVAAQRLGWLDIHRTMASEAPGLAQWAATIDASHIVLLGMGGSSLGPEVLRSAAGNDRLVVVDTTDPATVNALDTDNRLADCLFIVSSKSGTTLEVSSLLAFCWERVPVGDRYVAITDPDTALSTLADERGFARTFHNRPDIGGRYSVLSYFGLVPAALCGLDPAALCAAAETADGEEAVALGVDMAEAARAGRDKVTIVVPDLLRTFGLWVEQLIAESTGKHGRGCVPVPIIPSEQSLERSPDRHHVAVTAADAYELGREFRRWQIATAVAGHVLGVDPFDEPNVAESKANTERVLAQLPVPDEPAGDAGAVSGWLRDQVRPGDYVSLQAYLPYGQDGAMEMARRRLRDALGGMAVTAGYGPRFLHSTGQLHKGGPDTVVAVQVVARGPTAEVAVPGQAYDFATLIAAQAAGDLQSLREHGRRVHRVTVGSRQLDELG